MKKILVLFVVVILLISCTPKNNFIYDKFPDKAINITKEKVISEEDFQSFKYEHMGQVVRVIDKLDDETRKVFIAEKYNHGILKQRDVYLKTETGEYFRIEKYSNDILVYAYYLLKDSFYREIEYKRSGIIGKEICKYDNTDEEWITEYENSASEKVVKKYYKIYSKDGKLLKEGERK